MQSVRRISDFLERHLKKSLALFMTAFVLVAGFKLPGAGLFIYFAALYLVAWIEFSSLKVFLEGVQKNGVSGLMGAILFMSGGLFLLIVVTYFAIKYPGFLGFQR